MGQLELGTGAGRIRAFSVQEISPTQDLENANQEEYHAEVAQAAVLGQWSYIGLA